MAVKSAVLSVDEFARLPRPAGGVRQELHHGALVELPPVKKLHMKLQKRLVSLLEVRLAPAEYRVDKGVSVSSLPEYEVWVADVAVIVIEVLSPSDSASEMLGREEICLRHGGLEFWLVDPARETVNPTFAPGGHFRLFSP